MIQDLAVPLDPDAQGLVAQWAVKMAMLAEALKNQDDDGPFYTEEQRQEFRSSLTIPPVSAVWIGRYAGAMHSFVGAANASYDRARRQFKTVDAMLGTFCAGRFAFQVFGVHTGPQHAGLTALQIPQKSGQWSKATIQVWPPTPRTVEWPPSLSFTDHIGSSLETWQRRFDLETGPAT